MEVHRKHFPSLIPDNEEMYISMLSGVLESVDELSILQITRLRDSYLFRLSPSIPSYNNALIEELLKFHNLFKIHLDMSKSIKTSGVLTFQIHLNSD